VVYHWAFAHIFLYFLSLQVHTNNMRLFGALLAALSLAGLSAPRIAIPLHSSSR
jgi:hypothetical protein